MFYITIKLIAQVDNLLSEILRAVADSQRVLVSTLTKRMAEDLTDYYKEAEVRVQYMHSEVETLERVRIIRDLRRGEFDVLIGINLLREGLDIPEVALFAILDADKEGYLRSATSLIQMFGRAARNTKGRVIMYADTMTGSMESAIKETARRRKLQLEDNRKKGIKPSDIRKKINTSEGLIGGAEYADTGENFELPGDMAPEKIAETIRSLTDEMKENARNLEFEKASAHKKTIRKLKELEAEYISSLRRDYV